MGESGLMAKVHELKARLLEIYDLGSAAALLGWDQRSYMPPGGAPARARQIGALQRLAVRACVLENLNVRASIIRAWEMLREHLGGLALMWLALLGIGIAAVLVILLPFALLWALLWAAARLTVFYSSLLSLGLTLVVGLLMWLAGVVGGGIAESFFSAAWTLAYRDLTGMGRTGEEVTLIA